MSPEKQLIESIDIKKFSEARRLLKKEINKLKIELEKIAEVNEENSIAC